ncbi:MAG TPA: lactate utilization protein [Puia sp.]|nr:lactate utilization protein [Puia sp.]
MKVSQAKENILKKIRQALTTSTPLPFPQSEGNNMVFRVSQQELEIEFAEKFTNLLGKFIFCVNQEELASQLNALVDHRNFKNIYCIEEKLKSVLLKHNYSNFSEINLEECDAAITSCELLIARTGSIVMSTAQQSGRTASVYAPIHICISYSNQLVYDIKDGLQFLKDKFRNDLPSLITFATGPSRTADIEKSLVVGVHGPKEVFVFLVDDYSEE